MASEYWANVYAGPGWQQTSFCRHATREKADKECEPTAVARIHVRLKPEGAPKRYASEWNRRAWEETPSLCRTLVAEGRDARNLT